MKRQATFGLLVLLLLQLGCDNSKSTNHRTADNSKVDQSASIDSTPYILGVPAHFPAIEIPSDNPLTAAKVQLGKRLFFDKRLSVDGSVSCGSCHMRQFAFSDTVALSKGANGQMTERNAPSLHNVGFHPVLMREGAVKSLELQVLTPLEGAKEMAHNIVEACKKLNADSSYRIAFYTAFGDSVTPFTLTRAIAAYERTLIGGNAKIDQLFKGDSSAFTQQELLGFKLFSSSRLNCTKCHSGALFTNFQIENNGLYESYSDKGLYRLTIKDTDRGKFKVPSLRNVSVTPPYMHDGSIKSLEQVIDHYAAGGKQHLNQSSELKPFKLTQKEREALLAFFSTLEEPTLKN